MIKKVKKKLLDNKYYLAVVLFLTATCLHMLHSVLIKSIGLKGVYSTYEIIFIRSLVVAVILTPIFLLKKVKFIEKQNIKTNLLFAGFSIIGSYCWHYGLHMVPVNNAIIINYMIPMVIPILAVIFLKEKLSKTLIVSIIICFSSIIIINKPKEIWKLGYLLVFVDVCCYSMSVVISKKLMLKHQSPVAVFYFKVLIVIITSTHAIPSLSVKIINDTQILLPTLLVGILYLCENILFFTAYMLVSVSKLQPLYYTRIVFSSLISYLILGEVLHINQVILAIIIIIVNLNLFRVEKKNIIQ